MKTIVIAGGGTGGHIYPGIAIAQAIEQCDSSVEIHFIGSRGALEEKILPKEKYPYHLLNIGKLKGETVITQLKTAAGLPFALLRSMQILRKLKPHCVLGVGGYASGPIVLAASLLGYRTALWEPNAYPGLANRWLARFVDQCFVVFKEAAGHLRAKKIVIVGMPVRQISNEKKSDASDFTKELAGEFKVLVFGGSQGARAINNVVMEAIVQGGAWLDKVAIVHQTGVADFARINKKYECSIYAIRACEFLYHIHRYYEWADLVVCRAGASTLAELAAFGKAAILVPLPTAADNHQLRNAEALAEADGAKLIEQKLFTPQVFIDCIERLRANADERGRLEQNVKKFYMPNAGEKIARLILQMWQ